MKSLIVRLVNPYYHSLQRRVAEPSVRGWDQGEDIESMLERISSYDHERVHQRLSRKKLPSTTQWFTDHPTFLGVVGEKAKSLVVVYW